MTEAVRLNAKFSGVCKGCKKAILTGEPIVWIAQQGAWHDGCYDQTTLGIARPAVVHERRPQGPSPRQRLKEREAEALRTGVCDLCASAGVVINPVALRVTRATVWTCETCLEDMAAAARRA